MTRKIKASEVREGMEVEWSKEGITYQMQCQRKVEFKHAVRKEIIVYNFYTEEGGFKNISPDQTVTVLAEPQPDEPLAFGACVEVAGVKYVRAGSDVLPWTADETPHEIKSACTWRCLTNQGYVTVINADPFANTDPREPRVWKRWADVPEMTPVRVSGIEILYRKVWDRIECRRDGSWVPAFAEEYGLDNFSPFTEVLPGA